MVVMSAKVYRLNDEYGVQVWFSDGASVRFDGFDSKDDAVSHVIGMWGVIDVVVDQEADGKDVQGREDS